MKEVIKQISIGLIFIISFSLSCLLFLSPFYLGFTINSIWFTLLFISWIPALLSIAGGLAINEYIKEW